MFIAHQRVLSRNMHTSFLPPLNPMVLLRTPRARTLGRGKAPDMSSEPAMADPRPMSALSRRIWARLDMAAIASARRRSHQALAALLAAVEGVRPVWPELDSTTVPFAMLVRVDHPEGLQHDLSRQGFESELPIDRFFAGVRGVEGLDAYAEIDDLAGHVLALPVHQGMTRRHVERLGRDVRDCRR